MKAQCSEADLRTASLWLIDHPMVGESALAQLITDVRAAQRETDAKICAEVANECDHSDHYGAEEAGNTARFIEKRIREGT